MHGFRSISVVLKSLPNVVEAPQLAKHIHPLYIAVREALSGKLRSRHAVGSFLRAKNKVIGYHTYSKIEFQKNYLAYFI